MFAENVQGILTAFQPEIKSDPLLACLKQNSIMRPFLDVVLENTQAMKLNVCELESRSSDLYLHIMKYLADQPKLHLQVTVADTNLQEDDLVSQNVTPAAWDLSRDASGLGKFHLVVLNNVLHRQSDVLGALQKAAELVDEGGFLLVHEVTQNFPVFLALECLHKDLPLHLSDNGTTLGRYRSVETWHEVFTKSGLTVVMQTSDKFLSSLFLLRPTVSEVNFFGYLNVIFILLINKSTAVTRNIFDF